MKKLMMGAAALVATVCTGATNAQSMTYRGFQQVADFNAQFVITTDGTFGTLSGSNVQSYSIDLFGLTGSYILNESNSTVGGTFTADAAKLAETGIYFGITANSMYHDQPVANFTFYSESSYGYLNSGNGFFGGTASQDNDVSFAAVVPSDDLPPAVGAVPEPASWVMMLVGFGAIGGAVRSRREVNASFT